MRQWDIVDFEFPGSVGLHPAVVVSPDIAISNLDHPWINLLIVTTVRAGYEPGRYDIMLNGADGLDHLSRVRVLPIWQGHRSRIGRTRGSLSSTRQKAVAKKIRDVYRLD
jgi:hypothetical protein